MTIDELRTILRSAADDLLEALNHYDDAANFGWTDRLLTMQECIDRAFGQVWDCVDAIPAKES